jgi:hypothetical protein
MRIYELGKIRWTVLAAVFLKLSTIKLRLFFMEFAARI